MAKQKRDFYCPHYYSVLRKQGCYYYDIIGATLWLCKDCNDKLYKEVTEQKQLEQNIVDINGDKQNEKKKRSR